jgi:hypothetical protein
MITCPYLSDAEIRKIYCAVNLDSLEDEDIQEDVNNATGDLESRLVSRFKIPLMAKGGGLLSTAPAMTVSKVKLAMKTSLRNIIAQEYMRNSDLNQLGDYSQSQAKMLADHVKVLMNPESDLGLDLQVYAQDSMEPVQHIGIAKANNSMYTDYDE